MSESSTDRIEKRIELQAPVSRVWRALTDYREFGQWFRVNLEGPFIAARSPAGPIIIQATNILIMEVVVQKLEPERCSYFISLASARGHPENDHSHEPPTLVWNSSSQIAGGTLLIVTESGFDSLPAARRDEAFRMNDGGWTESDEEH